MTKLVSRRGFLRQATQCADADALRPPGAHADLFLDLCRDCNLCVQSCPEDVVTLDKSGRPLLDPTKGACTFCNACTDVCPTGALDAGRVVEWPWRAQVSDACLSDNGVFCRSCQDGCDTSAIRFRLQVGGRATALINDTQCTGCGGCLSICPVGAIQLRKGRPNNNEETVA